ncbi:hypothetical protein [Maridesulfovibrio zosterae]|uniref:hypothetical protein n=1 Tax=Maridesulfovibrio zosterae TaxID=82171 RepID=UPI0003F7AF24|nr:hypothetical protein [Maridesulfovibrio zosterae]
MRYLILTIFLLLVGCTSYYNPSLDVSVNRNERFKTDRQACRDRSKKVTNSEPRNDLQFLKTYDSQQKEQTNESKAFERCMAGKGWIKK